MDCNRGTFLSYLFWAKSINDNPELKSRLIKSARDAYSHVESTVLISQDPLEETNVIELFPSAKRFKKVS